MGARAQLLGQLYPQMPGKRQAALAQFQRAAEKHTCSGEVWQMLGELLAPIDPQGALPPLPRGLWPLPLSPDLATRKPSASTARPAPPYG